MPKPRPTPIYNEVLVLNDAERPVTAHYNGQVNMINRVDPQGLPPCWTVPLTCSVKSRPGRGHYVLHRAHRHRPNLTTTTCVWR